MVTQATDIQGCSQKSSQEGLAQEMRTLVTSPLLRNSHVGVQQMGGRLSVLDTKCSMGARRRVLLRKRDPQADQKGSHLCKVLHVVTNCRELPTPLFVVSLFENSRPSPCVLQKGPEEGPLSKNERIGQDRRTSF